MPRRKDPDHMSAEEEIQSVLAWAQRAGYRNITAALRRALVKWSVTAEPASAIKPDAIAEFIERGRRAQAAVNQAIAAATPSGLGRRRKGSA